MDDEQVVGLLDGDHLELYASPRPSRPGTRDCTAGDGVVEHLWKVVRRCDDVCRFLLDPIFVEVFRQGNGPIAEAVGDDH